jgi:hypothetical protein
MRVAGGAAARMNVFGKLAFEGDPDTFDCRRGLCGPQDGGRAGLGIMQMVIGGGDRTHGCHAPIVPRQDAPRERVRARGGIEGRPR